MNVNLRLDEVGKSYGRICVLHPSFLELQGGKTVVLLGVNGAGKTTLMRIMAGLENPDGGHVYYNNKPISSGELRKVSTLVFQKSAMFSTNVFNNLAYGLRIRNVPKEEIAEKVAAALQIVRLSGFEKRKAKRTSGGEQQRIALARAFLLQPHIMLLDEPTANLDPNNAMIIEKAIVSQKGPDRIIVIATHNLAQARRMADQIVHIHNGEIVEVAQTEDFFENPKSEITRKFINGELDF
jgi:tungstate transport system ATP-binding protein